MVNSNLLRGKIASCGLTQAEVAAAIGLSENSFSAKINNKASFRLGEVSALCSVLHITDNAEKCEIFLPESSQF